MFSVFKMCWPLQNLLDFLVCDQEANQLCVVQSILKCGDALKAFSGEDTCEKGIEYFGFVIISLSNCPTHGQQSLAPFVG